MAKTPTEVIIPDKHEVRAAKALAKEYDFDNCPTEYKAIKQQAIALYRMSGYAFVMMAHRLKFIRDGEMYKDDGYESFERFIAGELAVSKSTAYNYISLLEAYGETLNLVSARFPYRRLIKGVPLLKSTPLEKNKRVRKTLRHKLINSARDGNAQAFDGFLKEYEDKYGAPHTQPLNPTPTEVTPLERLVLRMVRAIPKSPTRKEKSLIRRLRDKLDQVL